MQETWVQWLPQNGLNKKYSIQSILDTSTGFRILLFDNELQKKLYIVFAESVIAYRVCDEGHRFKTIRTLLEKYGETFFKNWTFFKITNSKYIQWILDESCSDIPEIAAALDYRHLLIMADNTIVDIITTDTPKIEFDPET